MRKHFMLLLIGVVLLLSACQNKGKTFGDDDEVQLFCEYEMYEGEEIELNLFAKLNSHEAYDKAKLIDVVGENLSYVDVSVSNGINKTIIKCIKDFKDNIIKITKYIFECDNDNYVFNVDITLTKNNDYSELEPTFYTKTSNILTDNMSMSLINSELNENYRPKDPYNWYFHCLLYKGAFGNLNAKNTKINDISIKSKLGLVKQHTCEVYKSKNILSYYNDGEYEEFSPYVLDGDDKIIESWIRMHIEILNKNYKSVGFTLKLNVGYQGQNYVITRLIVVMI